MEVEAVAGCFGEFVFFEEDGDGLFDLFTVFIAQNGGTTGAEFFDSEAEALDEVFVFASVELAGFLDGVVPVVMLGDSVDEVVG